MLRPLVIATLALAAPAASAATFDGNWSVEIVTEKGPCDKAYRFPVNVEGSRITYSGQSSTTASGGVERNGRVRASFQRGGDVLDATGTLAGGAGRGTWTSASRGCSGQWNADRR